MSPPSPTPPALVKGIQVKEQTRNQIQTKEGR